MFELEGASLHAKALQEMESLFWFEMHGPSIPIRPVQLLSSNMSHRIIKMTHSLFHLLYIPSKIYHNYHLPNRLMVHQCREVACSYFILDLPYMVHLIQSYRYILLIINIHCKKVKSLCTLFLLFSILQSNYCILPKYYMFLGHRHTAYLHMFLK